MMKALAITALALTSSLTTLASGALAAPHASQPCGSSESWRVGPAIPARAASGLEYTIAGDLSLSDAFAQSESLARQPAPEARALARYWQGRAYYSAGLVSLAHAKFSELAAQAPLGDTAPVQAAALACLAHIEREQPGLSPRASATATLQPIAAYALSANERAWVAEYAFNAVRDGLAQGRPESQLRGALALTEASPAHAAYARGLLAARAGNHSQTMMAMDAFTKARAIPPSLSDEVSHAHLLAARAAYALGQYENAAAHYRKVKSSSNEFAQAMTELSWSYLLAERYPETIGATTNLDVGLLKTTFQPEAPMVAAMALNEICQYPGSLSAVQKFQRDYQSSYFWLKSWKSKARQPLYPLAVAAIQGKTQNVPARVATEWLRSSRFIAEQGRIASLFREEEIARRNANSGSAQLKMELSRFVSDAGASRRDATARINSELASRTGAMLAKLDEVAENSKLIQVEIYNGASHDMIWQHANSDFSEKTSDWKAESKHDSAGRVWNWGRVRKSGKRTEIWEDELGSLQANLNDNCSNKAKYLELKKLSAKN